ncbi:dihydroneopterin aldolase [Rhodocyclus tenuis]|uniref:7,8-dihydroneopterin aldolase n=1 Tax=Rhodocyclus tenuis TaxID=1066 RepID=A0A840GHQ0_RHOTE|nr:dihydroneopterin aldolase [Rhodocyclus tenuis]MBB4247709.1 dihydroneopterin aldolase [Rhodocyclus tenuis]
MTDLSRRNEDDCRIRIEALPLLASIGVYPHERAERQLLRVDIEFIVDAATASRSDDIAHTVDYDQVVAALVRLVGERHFNLLEAISQAMLQALADSFPMKRLAIRVHKPAALAGAGRVSVFRCLARDAL